MAQEQLKGPCPCSVFSQFVPNEERATAAAGSSKEKKASFFERSAFSGLSNRKQTVKATEQCRSYSGRCHDRQDACVAFYVSAHSAFSFSAQELHPSSRKHAASSFLLKKKKKKKKKPCGHGP